MYVVKLFNFMEDNQSFCRRLKSLKFNFLNLQKPWTIAQQGIIRKLSANTFINILTQKNMTAQRTALTTMPLSWGDIQA